MLHDQLQRELFLKRLTSAAPGTAGGGTHQQPDQEATPEMQPKDTRAPRHESADDARSDDRAMVIS